MIVVFHSPAINGVVQLFIENVEKIFDLVCVDMGHIEMGGVELLTSSLQHSPWMRLKSNKRYQSSQERTQAERIYYVFQLLLLDQK